jgi:hypothetical protein
VNINTIVYLYDNEYTSIIDIYFYEYFHWFKSWALALQNILDTLSDILDKCLRFSLIKIESVSLTQAKPHLVPSSHLLYILFY